uniref:Pecanex-like protein n=1 Tax=Ascaris lumbricoides TaxID=6252 RepID=A0A0M3I4B6_ASCLU
MLHPSSINQIHSLVVHNLAEPDGSFADLGSVADTAKRIELYSANRKKPSQEQSAAKNNVLERSSHSHVNVEVKQADFDKLLCFPMDREDPTLRSTDIVYEAADKKSVLLLREYVNRLQDSDDISTTPRNVYEAKETATLASEEERGRKQTLADASSETVVDQSESPIIEKESEAHSSMSPERHESTEMGHCQIPFYGQQRSYKDAIRSTRTAEQHIAPIPSTPQHIFMKGLVKPNVKVTKIWVNGKPTALQ